MDCTSDEPPTIKQEPSFQEDKDGAPIVSHSESNDSNDSKSTVKIGTFGNISKLMSSLASRDDSFLDLDLICTDGKILRCHKFILGAQSTYLRQLMLSIEQFGGSNEEDNRCKMNFPDVETEHMEIILKFLYTG